ncbi:hypothetical protein [Actinoplanes sp. NPDC026623]|uniref:hypothetical protein n=1 Tax=Actinoplanes sp. NPDC026623 TaxID=3155610 RepID=UPI00340FCEB7
MADKLVRIESWAMFGVKVAAGVAVAVYLYRRTTAARTELSATRTELTEAIDATRRDVAALHGLAADENAVYLRGWMDGSAGTGGKGHEPAA